MSTRRSCGTIATLLGVVTGALAGCGSSDPEETSGSAQPASATSAAARNNQNDFVAAVTQSTEPGLVELKFAVLSRPKVGEPVDIELAFTPAVDLERMFARFQPAEGLELTGGNQTEQIENPPKGVTVGHKVTVVPRADGIFYITAVVLADSARESISRTFTIPLIAGDGLPALPTPSPASVANEPQRARTSP